MSATKNNSRKVFIAITGASGSIYAERLLEYLLTFLPRVYLVITASGKQVITHELSNSLLKRVMERGTDKIRLFANDDFFAPFASGSNAPSDMVVIPCSMGTLSRVSYGASTNLLERVADVMLKQKKRLIIVPRETPLSVLHLENMLRLAQAGAHIVPACPAFYHKARTLNDAVEFVVSRVLDCLELEHNLTKRWNSRMV
ncbi:MAG: UbiX family flavin prenyltransferase [Pseudomonadota bacterium]|nr:UbiX family flavin prenyltransferase [Pseudomonadota bacterium]